MSKKDSAAAVAERYSVRCRYCGQKNNVREDYKNNEAVCGRCRLPLSNEAHKKFADLSKHDYVHPADSKALAALRAIPGIDTALKKLLAVTGESAIRVMFMASAVKVTPKQCPDLYAKLQIACTTLALICRNFTFSKIRSSTLLRAASKSRLSCCIRLLLND
jgi:hypothetical protein